MTAPGPVAALALLALAAQAAADAPPEGSGPRGTSQAFGAARYDAVGYASWYGEEVRGTTASGQRFDPSSITAAHPSLPMGSFAEVTSLDTGRTILVLITDRGPHVAGRIIDLSRGAAQLLGIDKTSVSAVRVRVAEPAAADQFALRSGKAAAPRLNATPQLIAALRKQLPATSTPPVPQPTPKPPAAATASTTPVVVKSPPVKPMATKSSAPPPAATPRAAAVTAPPPVKPTAKAKLFVQVAAFSSKPRAQALATTLGGAVLGSGPIYRVRLGPFDTRAAAVAARDGVARRGYGDARVVDN